MASKTSKLMVGLFTTLGVIIGVIAIIWIGASNYLEKGALYVTYFDESVQGLQKDSAVKYRGVEVGRVQAIRVAPDNRLIAVVMKIRLKDEDLTRTAVAQLKVAGITGLSFVELDRKKPGEPDQSPKISFPSEYPVIASRPSEIARILAGVNEVVEKFKEIDAKGVFEQLKATGAQIEVFFRGKKMEAILANMEATLANTKQITARVDKSLAADRLEKTLAEMQSAVQEARLMLANVNGEIKAMNLPATLGKTRAIAREVEATSENLRRTSETLESFMTRINDRPSDLLFGKPPKGRFNE
jgi:phospholipid/cholesterol/gamma-HCH transport system substrate-binding protein